MVLAENRNIIDFYHYWTNEAILADLDTKRSNFSIICENFSGDFNIATVIRNANAFLAREVIIVGRRKYDKRGTVGCHHYSHFKYVREVDSLDAILEPNPILIAIDNTTDAICIDNFKWPTRHLYMVFGEEKRGISPEMLDKAASVVYIKQRGSVRSLNVGTASGIAMQDYCRKRDDE